MNSDAASAPDRTRTNRAAPVRKRSLPPPNGEGLETRPIRLLKGARPGFVAGFPR